MSVEKFSDPAFLKRILLKAESEPVSFAFGIGARPDDSKLVVHLQKDGKQLMGLLKKEKTIKSAAFGTARADAKLLILDIEKKAPGLAKAAKQYIKAAPLKQAKVKLLFEGKDISDEEDEGEPSAPSAPTAPTAPSSSEETPSASAPTDTFSKAIKAWDKTVEIVEKDILSLQKAILTQMKGHTDLAQLGKAVKSMTSVLKGLDKRLDTLLRKGQSASSAEEAHAIAQESLSVLDEYMRHVKSDPILANMASNPFGKSVSDKLLNQTLSALRKSLSGI